MNWEAIGAVSEIVGAAAVVISIIYLAVQIRGQTREARLTATRELARDYRGIIEGISGDKELYEIYRRALENYGDLPDTDRMRIHLFFFSRMFGVHEQQHLHFMEGNIDPVFLESIRNRLAEVARAPGAQMWWQRNRNIYSVEFREYIDKVFMKTTTPQSRGSNDSEN